MEQHNKIINDVAKKILKPEGLFRIGSSRSWLEDNGYYFTVVEFQPSSFEKGSYLNVGIDFLWGSTEDTNEYLSYDVGGRVIVGKGTQYVEYRPRLKNCDKVFEEEIEKFAYAALQKVTEYRKFRDLDYAKKMLIKSVVETPKECQCWELYRLSMLCFFKGDLDDGRKYFDEYMDFTKRSFYKGDTYVDWLENFYNYCLENIVPKLTIADIAQQMVFDMVNHRRAIFSDKSSYRNMRKNIFYNVNSDLHK